MAIFNRSGQDPTNSDVLPHFFTVSGLSKTEGPLLAKHFARQGTTEGCRQRVSHPPNTSPQHLRQLPRLRSPSLEHSQNYSLSHCCQRSRPENSGRKHWGCRRCWKYSGCLLKAHLCSRDKDEDRESHRPESSHVSKHAGRRGKTQNANRAIFENMFPLILRDHRDQQNAAVTRTESYQRFLWL